VAQSCWVHHRTLKQSLYYLPGAHYLPHHIQPEADSCSSHPQLLSSTIKTRTRQLISSPARVKRKSTGRKVFLWLSHELFFKASHQISQYFQVRGQWKNLFQEDQRIQEAVNQERASSHFHSTLQVDESDKISRVARKKSKLR